MPQNKTGADPMVMPRFSGILMVFYGFMLNRTTVVLWSYSCSAVNDIIGSSDGFALFQESQRLPPGFIYIRLDSSSTDNYPKR